MYTNTVIFFISQEKFNLFIVISWKRTVNPILTCLPLYLKTVVHKMWAGYFTDNMQLYLSKMLCASFFIVNIINQIKYCGGWGVYSLWYRACKKKKNFENHCLTMSFIIKCNNLCYWYLIFAPRMTGFGGQTHCDCVNTIVPPQHAWYTQNNSCKCKKVDTKNVNTSKQMSHMLKNLHACKDTHQSEHMPHTIQPTNTHIFARLFFPKCSYNTG